MGKDSNREKDTMVGSGSSNRKPARPVSASPYSENYRPPIDLCQKHLINHRLIVSKLTRRELEDKYISLCDENYSMKKRFLEQEEQIKRLKTRLMRISSESIIRSKSRHDLSSSEHYYKLHELEIQRRQLHEKLEALRRATTFEGKRLDSARRATGTGATRQSIVASVGYRRSKSANRTRERDPSRDYKSSSPSIDGYEEEATDRVHRRRHRIRRTSTERTDEEEDEQKGHRSSAHRKSYGADDEGDNNNYEEDDEDADDVVADANGEGDEQGDDDRDVASYGEKGGTEENHEQSEQDGTARVGANHTKFSNDRKEAKSARMVQQHCTECERHRGERLTRETDLVKMKLNIKYLHKELQNEKEKSLLLARQLEEKLSFEIMKRNAAENLEIVNLNRNVDDLAKELQRQVEEHRRSLDHEMRKQGELEVQINKEKDKNAKLFEECEWLKKNIEKLKANMSEVEIERNFLKRQQENFTIIVDENKMLKYQLEELRQRNDALLKKIDSLREEELVTKESQRELLEKLKTFQQDNDTLSVMLEGLRTENEILSDEKTQLENNLKSLEASPIKEMRSLSPKPSGIDASVQTYEDEPDISNVENKTPRKEAPILSDLSLHQSKSKPFTYDETKAIETAPRHSKMSAQVNRDRPQHEMAEAARQVFRQVGSVSRMIPKLSHIINNRTDEPLKPSNVQLLLANSYPAILEKTFRDNDQFYDMQKAVRRKNFDRSSITSTVSDRRKISFVESTTTDEASRRDDETNVQENYARFFDIQRLPSTWQSITANAAGHELTTPVPLHKFNSPNDDVLTVEIRSIQWHEWAVKRLISAGVTFYYVEFAFLDLCGYQLETAPSVSLLDTQEGGRIHRLHHEFNFTVTIQLDAKTYGKRREQLKAMLQPGGNDALRFVVVDEKSDKSGEDIGYASIALRHELAESKEEDTVIVDAIVYSFSSPHDELGVLTIGLGNVKLLQSLMTKASAVSC